MGRRSESGGVTAKGERIQFDFSVNGERYRPTIDMRPTKANLQYAARRLVDIKRRITLGTFSFAEEFPNYRFIGSITGPANRPTFRVVGTAFLASIKGDVEHSTYESYRKILSQFWYPRIGDKIIADIRYSDLTTVVGEHPWVSRKTRNNNVSVGRLAFAFAVDDKIIATSPAEKLKSLKVQTEPPDPYTLAEVEALIAGVKKYYGEEDANYFEFSCFAGTRPSELIALDWGSIDLRFGTAWIDKARVMGKDKDRTKTGVARTVELCPHAIEILRRQKPFTFLKVDQVFGPYHDLQVQERRWKWVHKKLDIRPRVPYQLRHTSVTWNLMIGKNLLWVAQNHGHSVSVMLKVYAKWLKGSSAEDVAAIEKAMGFATRSATRNPIRVAEREGFEPS